MSFPPRFLDELRARLSLAEVVGRRVKLTRRGREFIGLCPFHNEKTPSFSVVEDKGFYHCFGCGVHGDVIGFLMQSESLGFLDAVEALARQAGLEVPKPTREEHDRALQVASLQGVVEAACGFFESALHGADGREAKAYLGRRGLDEATMRRFRLGYAPDRRDALKRALAKDCPETLLLEAGLLRQPEDRGEAYDYFRGRVMFPIGDRSGRVIAFGGRVLGEGQPKYLNSPETPLFEKGKVLYGWAQARAAAAREPSAIVVEGYMDVIGLHRAGFTTAVASLGTALTEQQIEELWRLAPEPVLCFDGDSAGQRAAGRALERALPLLRPGLSLRFATLPEGEDPDTLVLRHGANAMRAVLERARPLDEVMWTFEAAQNHDTPERRAGLEKRLEARIRLIADRSVQEHYRRFVKARIYQLWRAPRAGLRSGGLGRRPWGRPQPLGPNDPAMVREGTPAEPTMLARRQQEILLAAVLNHPFILNEVEAELAALNISVPELDRLCREVLNTHFLEPDLDAAKLRLHLSKAGFSRTVEGVLSRQVLVHAAFARHDADADAVRVGWKHTIGELQRRSVAAQDVADAERAFAADMSEENGARLQQTLMESKREDDGTTEGGVR